jgi:cytoskeleton protein RodZ
VELPYVAQLRNRYPTCRDQSNRHGLLRVTEQSAIPRAGDYAPPHSATAGALLRAAREAAGLSIDAVAQQLKLAPRQVTALEEDDYTHLPGRTFVRGFVRNYARFVRLDAATVLGALPAGAAAPALAVPTLQQTAPTMGELPVTDHARPLYSRWVIPLTLAVIVAVAALYEWFRPAGETGPAAGRGPAATSAERPGTPTPLPPNAGTLAPDPPPLPANSGTPLPNPLAGAAPATPSAAQVDATPTNAPAVAATAASAPRATDVELVLAFRDFSWTEVKDRDGRVLVSRMNPGGTTQSVAGTPPLELVIGNATDVSVTYQGKPVDLAPHTRQNVARFTLP